MGVDVYSAFRGIIIVDDDVVVVVVELILIASAYMRIRDGIPLEVIFIARCNAADALDTFRIAIALSTLCVAQDDPCLLYTSDAADD